MLNSENFLLTFAPLISKNFLSPWRERIEVRGD
jgi:hypothetical protein